MDHNVRPLPIFKSRFGKTLSSAQQWIMLITAILLVLMEFIYVLMRYLLHKDFPGFEELVRIIIFWLYFMGSANGSMERSHITADMVDTFVKSEKVKKINKIVMHTLGLVILGYLVFLSAKFVIFNIQWGGTTSTYRLPLATSQLAILIGFALMFFYDACHYVADILEIVRGVPSGCDEECDASPTVETAEVQASTEAGEER